MIEMRGICKSFGDNAVLEGFDLEVRHGELLGVIGASGAGKSLLLKTMVGLIRPDAGSVRINGTELTGRSQEELRRVWPGMGVVFQHGALFDTMTALQNVAFPLRMDTDLSPAEIEERARDCLAEVGLEEAAGRYPAQLSGGEQTRVGLARAVSTEPDFLFYDEPLRGLDPRTAERVSEVLARVSRKREVTAVMVSHAVRFVLELADRIAFLHEGCIRFLGTPDEARASDDPVLCQSIGAGTALTEAAG